MISHLHGGKLRGSRGFTLLEILVVLVLVSLTVGLVAPAGSRWLAAARERGWRDDLRAQLTSQPLRAFQEGRALQLDALSLRELVPDMPADVAIELSAPLRYGPTGAAGPAEIRLRRPGVPVEVWRIKAVTGEIQG